MAEIIISPNQKQRQFFESTARYTAYGGARGGGKSWAMRMKMVLLALSHNGINILLLRRTLGELRENHILPLQKLLGAVAEYREVQKEFRFPNGSRIKLGYCDAESDVLQYQGQSYEVIGLEEATHFTYFQYQCLTECNRASGNMDKPFPPRMLLTANPGGVGHDWFKRLFVDRKYRGNEKAENYAFIKSLVFDNDYMMKHNPEYVETLMALPEKRRAAMLYGDWDSFEGAFFPEFCHEVHSCRPFDIPIRWQRFRALDYGLDMTACLWLAVSPENRVYVYRELYESGLLLSEAARRIKEMTPHGESIRYTVASPDLWNRRQESGKSGAEIMMAAGLGGLKKADNSRITGWRVVREYLRDGEDGKSALCIFDCCENLIRCLPLLRFDDNVREDAADTPHEITHAPEALRYALMSRSPKTGSAGEKPPSYLYSFEGKPPEKNNIKSIIDY
ncbi:MAG: phage terminase large subunit [Clostridia bacterium]|nr:phage terminase large subunit [Clostridia bacterium]